MTIKFFCTCKVLLIRLKGLKKADIIELLKLYFFLLNRVMPKRLILAFSNTSEHNF
jgi:hypothetical protein